MALLFCSLFNGFVTVLTALETMLTVFVTVLTALLSDWFVV